MTFLTPRTIGGYWIAESVHPSAPMNFFSTKIVLQQFVLWCVLAAVVALLTLLFTVLGTITCAVLMGMMLAAVRHGPLRAFSISLVCPGSATDSAAGALLRRVLGDLHFDLGTDAVREPDSKRDDSGERHARDSRNCQRGSGVSGK
jgi:hypothetical protein